jgi:hypothetical protein
MTEESEPSVLRRADLAFYAGCRKALLAITIAQRVFAE